MAILAGTLQRPQVVGVREELEGAIYDISPMDTPFMSNTKRESVSNTLFEWLTDTLAPATTANAVIDGDDVSPFDAADQPTRVANVTQISRKTIIVSGTTEKVNKAARKSELARLVVKRGKELKRDMETIALSNLAANLGNTTTPRQTAGLAAWIRTSVDFGATGANPALPNPTPAAGRTDGTARAFTEALLRTVKQANWVQGGDADLLMLGPSQKVTASTFTGIATRSYQQTTAKVAAIIGAADIYVSDFGIIRIIANRWQRARDGWLLDTDYAGFGYLRPFKVEPLAKTGDAEKRMLLVEWGLKVHTERAHALIADLL
jgi:hypothetical protein